jgi:Gp19/Gp15/Gp42-like protein
MAAYATHEDVQSRYEQELDARLEAIVDVRLGDAERLIRLRIKDLDARLLLDPMDPHYLDLEALKQVESDMVLRLIRNPDGYSQESDGNYSYAIYQRVASGVLEVQSGEWALLGLRSGLWVLAPDLGYSDGVLPPDPSLAWQVNLPVGYGCDSADTVLGWWPH